MQLFEVIDQRLTGAPVAGGDITAEALKRRWLLPFAEGQYIYGPEWTGLVRGLQGLLLANAADMGFREYTFPRLIPAEAVDNFRLSQFKPELLWRAEGDRILDPVQCLPFYHGLRDSSLPVADLPMKIVETLGGWTWRHEKPEALDGVFRAIEFARVEHIWVAPPEQATDIRNQVLATVIANLEALGLSWQTVVGEACMPIEEIDKRREQAATATDVPVVDIETRVRDQRDPHTVTPQDFDEIGGCTIEGDHHLASFGITRSDGGPLWSGCCGVGLNRLAVGFLFQHGFDRANWPDQVAQTAASLAAARG